MATNGTHPGVFSSTGTDKRNVGAGERKLSLIGAGVLLVLGLLWGGGGLLLLLLLSGALLYRGLTGYCPLYARLGIGSAPQARDQARETGPLGLTMPKPTELHLESAITIDRPAEELYNYWRRQENLPNFMLYIESVKEFDPNHSHWVARLPREHRLEWDSEITADQPGERIAWRSLPGSDIDQQGEVRFQPAPGQRGVEVRLKLDMVPGGGLLGKAAHFFKDIPEQKLHEDLRRFKQLMETGELATTEGQPKGKAS